MLELIIAVIVVSLVFMYRKVIGLYAGDAEELVASQLLEGKIKRSVKLKVLAKKVDTAEKVPTAMELLDRMASNHES